MFYKQNIHGVVEFDCVGLRSEVFSTGIHETMQFVMVQIFVLLLCRKGTILNSASVSLMYVGMLRALSRSHLFVVTSLIELTRF